jgi:lysophospholipase L1-like esterase
MFRSRALVWSVVANVILCALVLACAAWRLSRSGAVSGRTPLAVAREDHLQSLDASHAKSAADARDQVDVVMLGDSLTQWAEWWELLHRPTANRGVADDTVALVQRRVSGVVALQPKVLCLMIGINDLLAGSAPSDMAARHAALVASIKAQLPNTRVIVQALLPVRETYLKGQDEQVSNATVKRANALLAAAARTAGTEWVDVGVKLIDASGELAAENTSDGVHLSARGYRIWADGLLTHLP